MNSLTYQYQFFVQLQAALNAGQEIVLDARADALGDKIARLNIAFWLSQKIGKITILETKGGRTPFMLSDYVLSNNINVVTTDIYSEYDNDDYPGLDITGKGDKDYLWIINSYLSTQNIRCPVNIDKVLPRTDKIVFCPLTGVEYNERRNWDSEQVKETLDILEQKFNNYRILYINDKSYEELASSQYSFSECVELLASSALVIAGDTGFSHLAAAFGTPLISIYPDWSLGRIDKQGRNNQIAEWFDLPMQLCHYGFYPNVDFKKWRLVELGADHRFSTEHLFQSVEKLLNGKA